MVTNARATKTRTITLEDFLAAVEKGHWQKEITAIRKEYRKVLKKTGSQAEAKKAIAPLKKKLPAVMLSGEFVEREDKKLKQHSGMIVADFDSLGERLKETEAKLWTSPYVVTVLVSPSGDGLKTVFTVEEDAPHRDLFRAVKQHAYELTGLSFDEACKNVGRLCFVTSQKKVMINKDAIPLPPLPKEHKPKPQPSTQPEPDLPTREHITQQLLGELVWDPDKGGYFCTCPGQATHTNTNAAKDTIVFLTGTPTLDCQHESCSKIVEAFNTQLRSLIGKAENHGVFRGQQQRETEWETDLSSLSSLNSLGARNFPAPLGEAAYYGLAGQVVRRILPETEADPVALLTTFLTGIGSQIGRNAYTIADGARHHGNMFVVSVGPTAVSRKGTALKRMFPVLKLADEDWMKDNVEDWMKDNVETGLSSGEGLVHRVRDQVTEVKQIKEKGRYIDEFQTVTVDHGIDDKRLLLIEPEFSSPLRVMLRDTNVLSAVLRRAWDGDDIGTLTKNSKEKATAPHISVLGHITREELNRSLNEIEAANGYGNRHLWTAVMRSKILPRGGGIPDIKDFRDPLQEVILFVQTHNEFRRDEEAEEWWVSVYNELTKQEGGMIGAMIARAAAHVVRLSLLYAVLDLSAVIRVPHLEAALALWRYAEASVRWIFSSGTGNRNADRILAALIASGSKGLTKTQIVEDVLHRNVTKFDVDEALRLLLQLNVVSRETHSTTRRPVELWKFLTSIREFNEVNEFNEKKDP
jgi:hypothetical protein